MPGDIAWCPGCGNYSILKAVKKALFELELDPVNVLFVSGIGQAGKFPQYIKCNMLNELHGRALPAAVAAKIVNPDLTVFAEGGDGDGYGEGGNHFMAAMQHNADITYLVHDNKVYGLTKGQASPTSVQGFVTKTTPAGTGEPLNPVALAVAADCSFVARGYAADIEHLSGLIKMAVKHRGFSYIDILQPCVTFNRVNTYQFYQKRVYKLDEDKNYDPYDRAAAFTKSLEWGDRIPIGLIYKVERPLIEAMIPGVNAVPLVDHELDPMKYEELLNEFI